MAESNPLLHRLSDADHRRIFEQDIYPTLVAGARAASHPVAVIFGGQPGAGKSAWVAEAVHELKSSRGAVQIIGDDLRAFHPGYARLMAADDKTAAFYTDRDTARWVEMSIAAAKTMRANLVIEGTMRDSTKVTATMATLRDAGYQIDARVMAVPFELSWQGVLQRYEYQKAVRGSGRMTTVEAHEAAFHGMGRTVALIEDDRLADRIRLIRRNGEVIYSNALNVAGEWASPARAYQALHAEQQRPFTVVEHQECVRGYQSLVRMMSQRIPEPVGVERAQLTELLEKAEAGLAAERFRQEPKVQVLEQHPHLAGAYSVMELFEARMRSDQVPELVRAQAREQLRQKVAGEIQSGHVVNVKDLGREIARPMPEPGR